MLLILFLVGVICVILTVFFIKAGNYESKIKSLEKKISEKKVDKKPVGKKKDEKENIIKDLKARNKKLKEKFEYNEKIIKENQQLRNQMAELEDKNKLMQNNKKSHHEQKKEFKEKLEEKDRKIKNLKNENNELKKDFVDNKKIRSYETLLQETLILQTFLEKETQRFIQILHNFSDISEKNLKSYLNHLCDINLLKKMDDSTFKRDFSLKKDEHVFEKIVYKIFDGDVQKIKKSLQ